MVILGKRQRSSGSGILNLYQREVGVLSPRNFSHRVRASEELRNIRSRVEDAASQKDDMEREPTGSVHPRDEVLRKSTPVDEKDVCDIPRDKKPELKPAQGEDQEMGSSEPYSG